MTPTHAIDTNLKEGRKMNLKNPVAVWVGAILLVLVYFYGLDYFIMTVQGLPVDLNLSPAQ